MPVKFNWGLSDEDINKRKSIVQKQNQANGTWNHDFLNSPSPAPDYSPPQVTPRLPKPLSAHDNPTVGENAFLVNAFPIKQNDNPVVKGLKGIGNAAVSTFAAPGEMLRKISLEGGSLLAGEGIKPLPKNTSFTEDMLPQGAKTAVNNFSQQHPVLGGVAQMGIETIADPTTFIGGNTVNKLMTPKAEIGMLKPELPLPAQSKGIKPPQVQNVEPLIVEPQLPKVAVVKAEQPKLPTLDLSTARPEVAAAIEQTDGVEPMLKERQFAQNVRDSNVATGEVKANLDENKLTYEPITNKETFDRASQLVKEDATKAREYFDSPNKGGVSADDVALGEALITKAIKEGNTHEANRLIADLAEKLTTAGQAVQAASIFKRLTPEGMLLYAQRIVNSANKDMLQRMGKKAKQIVLTADDSEFILDRMKQVQALPDGRERDVELAKVMQLIADKVPATWSEKFKGLQRISLLLNPKTMLRNVIGNTIFATLDNLSNAVATPIDMATNKLLKTGQRTTTLPNPLGQFKSGLQGAKETVEDARLGIDTYSGKTQYELPSKRIFDTKGLNALDKVTRVGLEIGDRPFYKAAYDDVLRQQMKLAGVEEPTQAMIEQAHQIAQQRTYQDVNYLTNAFKKAQQALNMVSEHVGLGSKEFGLGNIVLPFVKTPANILARALEYSPLGITKAIREASNIGKGTFNQKTFVDAISRSVTGTALIMVGYDLAKKGVITGSGNKDKDVAAFERNLGKTDYSYKVGNKYYTYDWAQPASMALAIGADIFLKGKDRKSAENVVVDAVRSGGETLFKQSLLQGIQRFMGGYSPMDSIANTAVNAPTQLIPTLGKQIMQTLDPTQRSTYSTSNIGTGINLVKSKIPGMSKSLEPKVDTFGNDMQTMQGKNNLFNIFLNPGTTSEFNPTKEQTEILKIYNSTGNKDVFPKVAPKSFTNKGETISLTPQEITTFQRSMGKFTSMRMQSVLNSSESDEVKAKELVKAIQQSYEDAKNELLRNRKK